MFVLLIALCVVVAILWQQVQALRARIGVLEFVGVPEADTSWAPMPEPQLEVPVRTPAHVVLREAAPVIEEDRIAAEPVVEEPAIAEALSGRPRAGFEDVFGRRLPIWAGGVTLAVAGFLIVRYSIEAGLLSPIVRVLLGLLFGTALIAGAEVALRRAAAVRDPRVRQALAGAGIATLYATILTAANLYHLVGPATAFAGMALVTALAGALSIRFGAASAVLGLVGGLAAPALVGSSEPNVPLLTLYLALAVGGLCALGRQQRWWWLGAAALTGGFGWGALLILGGVLDLADAMAVGLYVLALGIALPLLLTGDRSAFVRVAASAVACAQLAALVALGGFAPLHWGLFALLSIAIVWLSRREVPFADVPVLGLGVAILLAFSWAAVGPGPSAMEVAVLLGAMTAIYGIPAALRVWRDDTRRIDAPSVAAVAVAIGVLPVVTLFARDTSGAALIGAALAAGVAARGWRVPSRRDDARFATLAITAAVLLGMAGAQAGAAWTWAPGAALLALGLAWLGMRADDPRVERGGWAFAAGTAALLAVDAGAGRLTGAVVPGGIVAFATWAIPAAVAAVLAWRVMPKAARIWQPAAVVIGYGAAAQIVPTVWLPLVPAAIVATLTATRRRDSIPAIVAGLILSAGWAIEPLARWLTAGAIGAAGFPVTRTDWPGPADVALRVGLPGLTLLLVARLPALPRPARTGALAIAGTMLTIAAHVAWKQAFAIDDAQDFVRYAMAERTVWELALAAASLLAWQRGAPRAAIGFGIAALAHFAWFTGIVANPLWIAQDVGAWLAMAYAVAGALIWFAPRALPALRRGRNGALIVLIAGGAFTLLRQVAHTPMPLAAGTDPGEQIARSVLALILAGGFLWTGIRAGGRDWRIASLALMLIAVGKVFVFDAAGLDGLARIASFAALGFSLIGVGWLYSRYLPDGNRQDLVATTASGE